MVASNELEFMGVRAIRETANALLCVVDDQEMWIPKSQISDDSEVYEAGHTGTLIISEWLATQKGLV